MQLNGANFVGQNSRTKNQGLHSQPNFGAQIPKKTDKIIDKYATDSIKEKRDQIKAHDDSFTLVFDKKAWPLFNNNILPILEHPECGKYQLFDEPFKANASDIRAAINATQDCLKGYDIFGPRKIEELRNLGRNYGIVDNAENISAIRKENPEVIDTLVDKYNPVAGGHDEISENLLKHISPKNMRALMEIYKDAQDGKNFDAKDVLMLLNNENTDKLVELYNNSFQDAEAKRVLGLLNPRYKYYSYVILDLYNKFQNEGDITAGKIVDRITGSNFSYAQLMFQEITPENEEKLLYMYKQAGNRENKVARDILSFYFTDYHVPQEQRNAMLDFIYQFDEKANEVETQNLMRYANSYGGMRDLASIYVRAGENAQEIAQKILRFTSDKNYKRLENVAKLITPENADAVVELYQKAEDISYGEYSDASAILRMSNEGTFDDFYKLYKQATEENDDFAQKLIKILPKNSSDAETFLNMSKNLQKYNNCDLEKIENIDDLDSAARAYVYFRKTKGQTHQEAVLGTIVSIIDEHSKQASESYSKKETKKTPEIAKRRGGHSPVYFPRFPFRIR